jgi:hypothetical protein
MLKSLPISIEKFVQSLLGSFSGVPDVLSGSESFERWLFEDKLDCPPTAFHWLGSSNLR